MGAQGRPPVGKYTAVRLPEEMLARIDAFASSRKRAVFIREAVEAELSRREGVVYENTADLERLSLTPESASILHRYLDPLVKLLNKR